MIGSKVNVKKVLVNSTLRVSICDILVHCFWFVCDMKWSLKMLMNVTVVVFRLKILKNKLKGNSEHLFRPV